MVELKRQKLTFSNQPIGVIQRTNAVVQSKLGIAEEANKLNQIALKEMEIASTKKGEEAAMAMPIDKLYTLNSDGQFSAYDTKEFLDLGRNGQRAFEALADKKFMRSIQKDVEIKHKELSSKYEETVGGASLYSSAMEDYITRIVNNSPTKFKDIIRQDGIDTIQLGSAYIESKLRDFSNAASSRMIAEEFQSLAHRLELARKNKDSDLEDKILDMMDGVLTSAELLEATSGKARAQGIHSKYERAIANLGLEGKVSKIYSGEMSKTEADASHAYLISGGQFKDSSLTNNPDLLLQLDKVLDESKYWQEESISTFSSRFRDVKKSIITNSSPSSESKREEKLGVVGKANSIVENVLEGEIVDATAINKAVESLDKLSDENPTAYTSDRNASQKESKLIPKLIRKLSLELTSITDDEGNRLPSGAWRAVALYMRDGSEDDLKSYIDLSGESVLFSSNTIKKLKALREKSLSIGVLANSKILQVLEQDAGSFGLRLKPDEVAIKSKADEDAKAFEMQKRTAKYLKFAKEQFNLQQDLPAMISSEADIPAALAKIDDFINRYTTYVETEAQGKGKNIQAIILSDKANLQKLVAQRINQIVIGKISMIASEAPDQIEAQGLISLNQEKATDLRDFANFVLTPNEATRSKVKPEYLELFDKYYKREDISLESQRMNLFRGINSTAQNVINVMNSSSSAVKETNKKIAIQNGTADRDVESAKVVDSMLFQTMKSLGITDDDKTVEDNLKEFLFSEESLKKENYKVTNALYYLMSQGYASEMFVQNFENFTNLDEKQMQVALTHFKNLTRMATSDNRITSFVGKSGTNRFSENYGVSQLSKVFNELRAVYHIMQFRSGGMVQELRPTSLGPNANNFSTDPVVIPIDFPIKDLLNDPSRTMSAEQILIGYQTIMDSLGGNIKNLTTTASSINTKLIIKDLVNGTGIFNDPKRYKNKLHLFQPPEEILDIADQYWRKAMLDINLRDDGGVGGSRALVDYYSEFKVLLKDYVDQNYMETDGNVLDFSQMNTMGTTLTSLHPRKHLGDNKYYAMVDYINDRLPPNMVFDFNATQTQEFLAKYRFTPDVSASDTLYAQIEEKNPALAKRYEKELKAGEDFKKRQDLLKLDEVAKEQGISKVVLVAYETNAVGEIIYQAMRVTASNDLAPVMVEANDGETLPFLFSLGSLHKAFEEDGVYDEIFEDQMREARELRERLIQ